MTPPRDAMDVVSEQLQLLERRVAYLEELTAHKEAAATAFSGGSGGSSQIIWPVDGNGKWEDNDG